jgi:hypothetical protein
VSGRSRFTDVTIETFSTFLLVGSALAGLWVAMRFARLTPKSLRGAAGLLLVTMVFATAVAPALVRLAVARLPFAAAAMLGAFPALVVIFAANALVLRYFVRAVAPSSAGRR